MPTQERDTERETSPEATTAPLTDADANPGSGGMFGALSPQEAAQRSVESRREKAAKRSEDAEQNALTFRQRLGVALSKLTQRELDAAVKASTGSAVALARFADQAFGKPREAEEDRPEDDALAALTREQRAVLRSWLDEPEDDLPAQDA